MEEHFRLAASAHLCRLYAVILSDDEDRRFLSKRYAHRLNVAGGLTVETISAQSPLSDVEAKGSLFGQQSIWIIEDWEEASSDWSAYVRTLDRVILSSKKKIKEPWVEKEGIILDLSQEKPWDKETRRVEILHILAKESKVALSDRAALALVRKGGTLYLLEQELHKALCFVAPQRRIEERDVVGLANLLEPDHLWKVGQRVVWEQTLDGDFGIQQWPALAVSLRSELVLGAKLAYLIDSKAPMALWEAAEIKLFPSLLEKRKKMATQFGSTYFQRGLSCLHELEWMARRQSVRYARAYMTIFCHVLWSQEALVCPVE
jgi:hypothetical protein